MPTVKTLRRLQFIKRFTYQPRARHRTLTQMETLHRQPGEHFVTVLLSLRAESLGRGNTRVELRPMIYTRIMTVKPWRWQFCLVFHTRHHSTDFLYANIQRVYSRHIFALLRPIIFSDQANITTGVLVKMTI